MSNIILVIIIFDIPTAVYSLQIMLVNRKSKIYICITRGSIDINMYEKYIMIKHLTSFWKYFGKKIGKILNLSIDIKLNHVVST